MHAGSFLAIAFWASSSLGNCQVSLLSPGLLALGWLLSRADLLVDVLGSLEGSFSEDVPFRSLEIGRKLLRVSQRLLALGFLDQLEVQLQLSLPLCFLLA